LSYFGGLLRPSQADELRVLQTVAEAILEREIHRSLWLLVSRIGDQNFAAKPPEAVEHEEQWIWIELSIIAVSARHGNACVGNSACDIAILRSRICVGRDHCCR